MKQLIGLIVGCVTCIVTGSLIAGCGAAREDDDLDLAQVEQDISIGNGGYGFTNAAAQLRCAQPGVSGQICFASAVKRTATYCFTGAPALTNTDKAVLDQVMQGLNAQTNWHFAMSSFPCDVIFQRSTSTAGSTSANVENFMTASPTGTVTSLTSPAGVSHVNGTWTSFDKLSVVLKLDKLSIVAAPARAQEILRHMGAHVGALYMGLGTQQDPSNAGISSPTRRIVDLDGTIGTPGVLTAGEVCRANNEVVGTPNQISAVFGCGF